MKYTYVVKSTTLEKWVKNKIKQTKTLHTPKHPEATGFKLKLCKDGKKKKEISHFQINTPFDSRTDS